MATLLFARFQKKYEEDFDTRHANVIDFGIEISGLPKSVKDPRRLLSWLRAKVKNHLRRKKDMGEALISVSIAYDYERDR